MSNTQTAEQRDDFALRRAQNVITKRLKRREQLRGTHMAKFVFQLNLHREERECFEVLYLDNQHGMIAVERLFQGSAKSAEVHPGVVARQALLHNAQSVLVAHNHPSGNPVASRADRLLTHRLREALALVDVQLLDHILIAGDKAVSFVEEGWW